MSYRHRRHRRVWLLFILPFLFLFMSHSHFLHGFMAFMVIAFVVSIILGGLLAASTSRRMQQPYRRQWDQQPNQSYQRPYYQPPQPHYQPYQQGYQGTPQAQESGRQVVQQLSPIPSQEYDQPYAEYPEQLPPMPQ